MCANRLPNRKHFLLKNYCLCYFLDDINYNKKLRKKLFVINTFYFFLLKCSDKTWNYRNAITLLLFLSKFFFLSVFYWRHGYLIISASDNSSNRQTCHLSWKWLYQVFLNISLIGMAIVWDYYLNLKESFPYINYLNFTQLFFIQEFLRLHAYFSNKNKIFISLYLFWKISKLKDELIFCSVWTFCWKNCIMYKWGGKKTLIEIHDTKTHCINLFSLIFTQSHFLRICDIYSKCTTFEINGSDYRSRVSRLLFF